MTKSRLSEVAHTLMGAGIDTDTSAKVLHAMLRAGHIEKDPDNGGQLGDGGTLHAAGDDRLQQVSASGFVKLQTPLEASADPQRSGLLRSVVAQCRQLGVSFDPERPISMMDLDRQLVSKDVAARLKLKQTMALCGLIA
jgi:hypothetical protein